MEKIDLEKIKIDKEYFKEVMLSEIERYKNIQQNWGLCFIYDYLFKKSNSNRPDFFKAPNKMPNLGYNSNGSIRTNYAIGIGYWWKNLNIFSADPEDWYAPRIEYLKNL